MIVRQYINSIFRSNTYLLSTDNAVEAWVIDPGDSKPILDWVSDNGKTLSGVLFTHSHFDHIYGANDLVERFPSARLISSFHAREGLLSSRLNRSYYTENPFEVRGHAIEVVEEGDLVKLTEQTDAMVYSTPGHNHDCLTFRVRNYLFTGDALIPGIKVVTKSKHASRTQAKETILRILNEFDPEMILCPGHGEMRRIKDIELQGLF